ncbi:uncharacterized protein EV422DRAFT_303570 [Fimicolochytrium jonesii]|uniref:uncharacterized protein n=1 Tax=Fimicolochytrium jonesii TaxID=1396493 RepID=UPI0022FE2E53|nr:uncharacterized protein EV422DRAFT_303570 [Fimicolochytrium jonesii]KAI8824013.1 hypothetical protein EV422DRAFT_303570 [Fimicolochytrium jonesii]
MRDLTFISRLLVLAASLSVAVTALPPRVVTQLYANPTCTGNLLGFKVYPLQDDYPPSLCEMVAPLRNCSQTVDITGKPVPVYSTTICYTSMTTDQLLSSNPSVGERWGSGNAVYREPDSLISCGSGQLDGIFFLFGNGLCPATSTCRNSTATVGQPFRPPIKTSTGSICGKFSDVWTSLQAGNKTYGSYVSSPPPASEAPGGSVVSGGSDGSVISTPADQASSPSATSSAKFSGGIYTRFGGSCFDACIGYCIAHVNITVTGNTITSTRVNDASEVKPKELESCPCTPLKGSITGAASAMFSTDSPGVFWYALIRNDTIAANLISNAGTCSAFLKKDGSVAATDAAPVVLEKKTQAFRPGQEASSVPVQLTSELKMRLDTKGALVQVDVERKSAPPAGRSLPASATSLNVFYTIDANTSQAVDATLDHVYDDLALAAAKVATKDLRWAYLKVPDNVWVPQTTSVNTTAKTVSCQTTHFSEWTVYVDGSATKSSASTVVRSPPLITVGVLAVIASVLLT